MFDEILQKQAEALKQFKNAPAANFTIRRKIGEREIQVNANNLQLAIEGYEHLEKKVMDMKK